MTNTNSTPLSEVMTDMNITSLSDIQEHGPDVNFHEVTLSDWLERKSLSPEPVTATDVGHVPLPLIDLRTPEEYRIQRIGSNRNATPRSPNFDASRTNIDDTVIVNLPLEGILSGAMSCELPPRDVEFAILLPKERNAGGAEMDKRRIQDFFFATQSRATKQSRKAWLVRQVLVEGPSLWEDAATLGCSSSEVPSEDDRSDEGCCYFPSPRLWKPDPLVREELLPLLINALKQQLDQGQNSFMGEIWDLGSGSGRDVCFLAEETKHFVDKQMLLGRDRPAPYRFPLLFAGLDNHKGSAQKCLPFWKRRGVEGIAQARLVNLKKTESFHESLENNSNKVVLCYAIRYLNRSLLNYLTSDKCALKCGSVYGMSHFCKDSEGAEWNFDHPKEKNVLERNELTNLFQKSGQWTVLKDSICFDGDHGRTLIQFVARKL